MIISAFMLLASSCTAMCMRTDSESNRILMRGRTIIDLPDCSSHETHVWISLRIPELEFRIGKIAARIGILRIPLYLATDSRTPRRVHASGPCTSYL
jgi:hypothetical protein